MKYKCQEPSNEQREALNDMKKEIGHPETEISCWLLEALASEAKTNYVDDIMHHSSTLAVLAR